MNSMRSQFLLLFITLGISLCTTAQSAIDVDHGTVFLYQPDAPLRDRLASAEDLVAHIQRLKTVGTAFFASEQNPEILDVVVGVKPGKKVRVWLISSRRSSNDKSLIALGKKLEAVRPCTVQHGPIVFALRWIIGGNAARPSERETNRRPIPKEWRDAGKLIVPDQVFERVWPD